MSDQGVRLSSARSVSSSGFDYVRPPTSEGHNSFVQTPFRMILGSMESPLSKYYIHIHVEDSGCQAELGKVSSARLDLTTYDLQLRKVITSSSEFRFGCS